jgi:transcriptional regulator with AAA-type ATPase domain
MNENQGRMGMKGSLGSDVELLDIWKSRQENSTSETTCPKSPEEENNYLFKSDREFNTVNKNFKSTDDLNLNRPISPVAELLDSMESENEKDEVLQENNFKKYDEDDRCGGSNADLCEPVETFNDLFIAVDTGLL